MRVTSGPYRAESQKDAIDMADKELDLEAIFPYTTIGGYEISSAGSVESYLVDEVGDEEFERSTLYDECGKLYVR